MMAAQSTGCTKFQGHHPDTDDGFSFSAPKSFSTVFCTLLTL
jgi:hypothetical protein